MNRPREVCRGRVAAIRERFLAVAGQSERTLLLGTVLLASAVSAATGYVLAQCFSFDIVSSLLFIPEDCYDAGWSPNIGRHCFSDYGVNLFAGLRPNPWEPIPMHPPIAPILNPYPAAAMLPQLLFGLPAKWLGAPLLGMIGYLLALTIAVLSPAVWAARGARGLERVVVFVALGAAAIPAWEAIDRGNSTGFVVPIAMIFLVALCRRRWGLVAIMVVLAALVKPQFAVLAVVLFAARQWRLGGVALGGIAISNLGAYLLWPQDFPETITQSIHNVFAVSSDQFGLLTPMNVSFGRGLLFIPDLFWVFLTGKFPEGLFGLRRLIGYAVLVFVVVSVLALGRRIAPVMVGIVLLATAALFPPLTSFYYLVFVLPVGALVVRDPGGLPGSGIFDRLATHGARRRGVGICVSLAAAFSIAQIAIPLALTPITWVHTAPRVNTTEALTPILWLVACAVIIVSYARRPAPSHHNDQGPAREGPPDTAVSTSPSTMN
ncbi:glycosyltransferase family 87 protein [Mycobacterium seoulense]|uniref:glycosyltransferase family 87 protein n=1 Tax=Mycobacterium seoulense TaxID=386911 RepID=UPI003CE88E7B